MKTRKCVVNCIMFLAMSLLILIDQVSKNIISSTIPEKSDITVINKVFKIVYVKNTGAAWGMFSSLTGILTVVSLLILAVVVFLYLKMDWNVKRQRPLMIICVFVASGAIGNMIDRIFLKYVVDFLYFELIDFPVFNIADCYITVSMAVLLVLILFYFKDDDFAFLNLKKHKSDVE